MWRRETESRAQKIQVCGEDYQVTDTYVGWKLSPPLSQSLTTFTEASLGVQGSKDPLTDNNHELILVNMFQRLLTHRTRHFRSSPIPVGKSYSWVRVDCDSYQEPINTHTCSYQPSRPWYLVLSDAPMQLWTYIEHILYSWHVCWRTPHTEKKKQTLLVRSFWSILDEKQYVTVNV